SMTAIDCLVLFGPETPALYRPLGKNIHVLWAGLACSPCVSAFNHRISTCNDNVCMQSISVEQVFAKLDSILQHKFPTVRPRLELQLFRTNETAGTKRPMTPS